MHCPFLMIVNYEQWILYLPFLMVIHLLNYQFIWIIDNSLIYHHRFLYYHSYYHLSFINLRIMYYPFVLPKNLHAGVDLSVTFRGLTGSITTLLGPRK